MLELYVGSEGNFSTISEAIHAVPYHTKAIVYIAEGIYEEKIFCEKKNITLIGAGPDKTIIRWADYALKDHSDGRKFGTFRSYTAFFAGRVVTVKDLSILNTSGDNKLVGGAIAAYVDTEVASFHNVHFDSYQNTLFCAPLPDSERENGDFFGPRAYVPPKASFGFYYNCKISGNIDFIFGGGDVLFYECQIRSKLADHNEIGYISAPSGKKEGAGFMFTKCQFFSLNCAKGSVYLARPWRVEGKTTLLNCYLDEHIHEEGWSTGHFDDRLETNFRMTFSEFESYGPGANQAKRVKWAKLLDFEASRELNERIEYAAKAWGIDDTQSKIEKIAKKSF